MILAYSDDGPGPPVVLLHGFPLSRSMWDAQRGTLGSRYRVIAPDLRGHGESAAIPGVATVDAMADDVIETLDGLQLRAPLVLGGLSMGGYVALSIAERYPERLRALMLLNTRAKADPPETARVREDLARQVEAGKSPEPVVSGMLPKLFSPLTYERKADLVDRMRQVIMATDPAGVAATLRGLAVRPDRTGILSSIRVPTLVLAGSDDALIPREESEAMAGAIPDARLVIVPEAGHLAPLENPADSNRSIEEFLDSLA